MIQNKIIKKIVSSIFRHLSQLFFPKTLLKYILLGTHLMLMEQSHLYYLLLHRCDQILDRNNMKKEEFILVHNYIGFSPYSLVQGSQNIKVRRAHLDGSCSPHDREEAERERDLGLGMILQRHVHSDPLLPVRLHLPKF